MVNRASFPIPFGRWLRAALVSTVLWWIVAEGDPASWVIGVPVVIASATVALLLRPTTEVRISLPGLATFLPYFAWRSLAGGIDVAARAVRPSLPISPSLQMHRLRLPPDGPARVFFVNTLSLLPGTLAAELDRDEVTVHVLAASLDIDSFRRLEQHVGQIFRSPPDGADRRAGGGHE